MLKTDKKHFLNIAIIGASGALGQEFVRQLAANENTKTIFAFSRSKTKFNLSNVESHLIDIENENSIELAANLASKNSSLDVVIVASGLLHDKNLNPEKSLRDLSQEKFHRLFSINAVAPAIIAKYFLPKLTKDTNSIFASLSARVSSISDNSLGGWYSYRASKAALNMILKNASIEIKRSNKNAIVVGLHPGTVDSNLSKPFQSSVAKDKLFTAEFSVQNLLKIMADLSPLDSGNLFDFNGKKIDF